MEWETVIGLEVHVQLATQSKIFSGAACTFGAEPNTQACDIDVAIPGTLPVFNAEALKMAVRFGLSVDAVIAEFSQFARKNYFYPDLPKGYQISQHLYPIVGPGHLMITLEDGTQKRIGITRAHLEEDAGKSLHGVLEHRTGIDLNRAGTPLLEIVSEPDMRTAKEAVAYLKSIHGLVRYLQISDANMQEGSFRCDVNVSVRPKGQLHFGTRAEVKNINSFRFVEKAIEFEAQRQIEILEADGTVAQETRLYDPDKNETRSLRSKENAHDYRYFPDPDLLPVEIDSHFIAEIRRTLPELPWQKATRFQNEFQLSVYDAELLAHAREMAFYFETALAAAPSRVSPKMLANWILSEISAWLNKTNLSIEQCPVTPIQLITLLTRVADGTISNTLAKTVFEALWNQEGEVDAIIEQRGLKQISDAGALEKIIAQIVADHPQQAEQLRGGKDKLLGFFVGQVMKATQGKANPEQVNALLMKKLRGD